MKHGVKTKKMGRKTSHRNSMLKNLLISLVKHKKIKTTLGIAKGSNSFIEKTITKSRHLLSDEERNTKKLLSDQERISKKESLSEEERARILGATRYFLSWIRSKDEAKKFVDLLKKVALSSLERNGGYTRIIKISEHRYGDAADQAFIEIV
jgi:large subunit ribosomal protein L17